MNELKNDMKDNIKNNFSEIRDKLIEKNRFRKSIMD